VQTTQKAKILPFKGGQGIPLMIVCLYAYIKHNNSRISVGFYNHKKNTGTLAFPAFRK